VQASVNGEIGARCEGGFVTRPQEDIEAIFKGIAPRDTLELATWSSTNKTFIVRRPSFICARPRQRHTRCRNICFAQFCQGTR
jgi:hypothetical protein